jgi:signal transduction histidine kinase
MPYRPRTLTFRYLGALLAVAGLLVAGQILVQRALDRQEEDARVINLAGRQRMLSQRLTMLLLAIEEGVGPDARADRAELERVTDEWEHVQHALRMALPETGLRRANSRAVEELFASIAVDHAAMATAARAAIAAGDGTPPTSADGRTPAAQARAHQGAFLAGMERIVAAYEAEARGRVVELRRVELALLALALVVLVLEGAFVFRPAVTQLRAYLAERDRLERELLGVSDREQRRIAQDLHDGLSQHLVGVAMLARTMRPALEPAHRERLEEIERLLDEAVAQTRGLAHGLYSHTVEVAGLAAALTELAAQTERLFGIACRFTGDTSGPELPLEARMQLHRHPGRPRRRRRHAGLAYTRHGIAPHAVPGEDDRSVPAYLAGTRTRNDGDVLPSPR